MGDYYWLIAADGEEAEKYEGDSRFTGVKLIDSSLEGLCMAEATFTRAAQCHPLFRRQLSVVQHNILISIGYRLDDIPRRVRYLE